MNLGNFDKIELNLSIKQLIALISAVATVVGAWWFLKSDIEKGMIYPIPGTGAYQVDFNDRTAEKTWPPTRNEYEFKYNTLQTQIKELERRIDELENE